MCFPCFSMCFSMCFHVFHVFSMFSMCFSHDFWLLLVHPGRFPGPRSPALRQRLGTNAGSRWMLGLAGGRSHVATEPWESLGFNGFL